MATAALVCGIAGLLLFVLVVPSIVALVLGLIAWRRGRAAPGPGDATGRALAGWVLGLIGVASFVALIVGAIVSDGFDDGDVAVADLRVGQCIDLDVSAQEVTTVPARDCDEPHDAEVFLVDDLAGSATAAYPGDEAMERRATELCTGAAFERYVGTPLIRSSLMVRFGRPSERSWEAGDRGVVCAAMRDDGGRLSETVEGSGE